MMRRNQPGTDELFNTDNEDDEEESEGLSRPMKRARKTSKSKSNAIQQPMQPPTTTSVLIPTTALQPTDSHAGQMPPGILRQAHQNQNQQPQTFFTNSFGQSLHRIQATGTYSQSTTELQRQLANSPPIPALAPQKESKAASPFDTPSQSSEESNSPALSQSPISPYPAIPSFVAQPIGMPPYAFHPMAASYYYPPPNSLHGAIAAQQALLLQLQRSQFNNNDENNSNTNNNNQPTIHQLTSNINPLNPLMIPQYPFVHSPPLHSAPPSISVPTFTYGRFILQEQPSTRQRKSYKSENRYLMPNPFVICPREPNPGETLPAIIGVSKDGQELPPKHQNILECTDGASTQKIDSQATAQFSLKILETSEGTMFRLLFVVKYSVEEFGSNEEKIISRPFVVYSNRKKCTKETPVVLEMRPTEGLALAETEVWIKGRDFGDRVQVQFGDKLAKVVEAAENLITAIVPSRADIVNDTDVVVEVSNKYQSEKLTGEKKLSYTYRVGPT